MTLRHGSSVFARGGSADDLSGFTLIEMLTVVIMIGILVAAVVPPISRASRRMALDSAAQAFLGDLRRARIEAVKRNQGVTVKRTSASAYSITFLGSRELDGEAYFVVASSADSVRFASFGPILTPPATFTIQLGQATKTVAVNASGLAKVQ